MIEETKLLPCPFCGGEAAVRNFSDHDEYEEFTEVYCTKCDASMLQKKHEQLGDTINRWQKRVIK